MSSTPPDAPTGPTDPNGRADSADRTEYGESGPRVSRDEARDLGRIRRSVSDRKIAGVAGGIARHFDVDPLLVRVGFVLLTIFGGGGVIAYAAGWLLIPEEGTDDAPVRLDERTRTIVLAIVGVVCALSLVGDSFGGWGFPWPLAIAGLVVAGVLALTGKKPHPGPLPAHGWVQPGSAAPPAGTPAGGTTYATYRPTPPPAPPNPCRRGPILFWFTMALAALAVGVVGTLDLAGVEVPDAAYPATVLATCGVMLLVGAFYGRPGGIIFVGLVSAVAVLATSVADTMSVGQVNRTPTSAAQLADGYDLGAGEMVIDLSQIEDLDELDGRTLELDVTFGRIEVRVPEEGLDVTASGGTEGGDVRIFGNSSTSSDSASHDGGPDRSTPELTIDAEVVFGEIDIDTVRSAA